MRNPNSNYQYSGDTNKITQIITFLIFITLSCIIFTKSFIWCCFFSIPYQFFLLSSTFLHILFGKKQIIQKRKKFIYTILEFNLIFILGLWFNLFLPWMKSFQNVSDYFNPPRGVVYQKEIAALSYMVPPDKMKKIKIGEGPSLITQMLVYFFHSDDVAFVLDDAIYSMQKMTTLCLRHETIHILQIQENGFVPFLGIYFADFFVNFLSNGLQIRQAYLDVLFEKEAYNCERLRGLLTSNRCVVRSNRST